MFALSCRGTRVAGLLASAALTFTHAAFAEESGPTAAGAAGKPAQKFRRYRWEEDYAYLARESFPTQWEKVKYIPLPWLGDAFASTGGEIRYRLDGFSPYLFGIGKSGSNWISNQERIFSHLDIHFSKTFRTFFELDGATESGRPVQRPYDQSAPDLRQAFFDIALPAGSGTATLRSGREEIYLGSSRWLAVRDPTNIRRSFDGFVGEYKAGQITLRAFAARPVNIAPGCFDDRTLRSESFTGAYAILRNPFDLPVTIDSYLYQKRQGSATYARGTAAEERWSGGGRLDARLRGFHLVGEATWQWGSFGSSRIKAFGMFADLGYRFSGHALSIPAIEPKIGVRTHFATGDSNPQSSTFSNFTAAYPAASVISEVSVFGASNIQSIQPYGQLFLPNGLVLGANWNFLRRVEIADSVYGPPGTILTARGSTSRDVARIGEVNLTWQINRFTQVHALYSHIYAGNYVRDAGGHSFDYYRLQLTTWW
ncbi:MAG: alginate export family protein [Alphaproteobacteria bacterium]|nr:alginate export family protein [Alphaproteobacteria bacterium]